ncbi:MAG TPA: transglycosylase SLT domain-containing protein [bacterium]|nr:transglycosylase SLT domain-containing protein [bacterium]
MRSLLSLMLAAVLLVGAPAPGLPQPPPTLAAAVTAYSGGDLPGARAMLTSLAQDPGADGGRASYLLGVVDLATTQYADAEASFDRAGQALPVLADCALYYQSLAALDAGQYGPAAQRFQELLVRFPQSTLRGLALFQRAESLRGQGSPDAPDAYHVYLEAFGAGQHAAQAWYEMGTTLESQNRWADAAQAYRRVLWVFPDASYARSAYLRLRTLASAHVLPPDATPPVAVYQRGANDFAAGRMGAARAELMQALHMPGGWIVADGALYTLGVIAYQAQRLDEATAAFQQDVALKQMHADDSLYYLVRIALTRGRDADALATARLLARTYPRSSLAPRGLYAVAAAREDRGTGGPAVALFREAASRFPGTRWGDRALWEAGWIQYRLRAWQDALAAWRQLANTAGDTEMAPAGSYWAARAAAAAGDGAGASDAYRQTAAKFGDSFYGQMAAAQIGVPLRVPIAQPMADLPPGELATLDRFRELDALAQTADATRELEAAAAQAPPADRAAVTLVLGQYYERQQQVARGILAAEQAQALYAGTPGAGMPLALWEALYPQAAWQTITQAAGRTGTDPYLVAGVMREESRFDPSAVSPAGAYGLMQLMPGTAKSAARTVGVAPPDLGKLTDAQTNVLLGAVVLAELLKQFGRADLAVAAYNAGPEAVKRWQGQRAAADAATFDETIPYPETRAYVKVVLQSAAMYRWLYRDGHPAPP